jgi:hypothetical protein
MLHVPNIEPTVTTGPATDTAGEKWATRRRRMARLAVFGGGVLAALAVASPAMAWPAMGC